MHTISANSVQTTGHSIINAETLDTTTQLSLPFPHGTWRCSCFLKRFSDCGSRVTCGKRPPKSSHWGMADGMGNLCQGSLMKGRISIWSTKRLVMNKVNHTFSNSKTKCFHHFISISGVRCVVFSEICQICGKAFPVIDRCESCFHPQDGSCQSCLSNKDTYQHVKTWAKNILHHLTSKMFATILTTGLS